MADDLSLLLRIKGDASGAKAAAAETRTAIASLRTSLQSAQGSFQAIGGPLTGFSGQLGNASSLLSVLQTDAAATGGALAGMAGPIGIAVAAFAALATGAITLTKQFIDLTISTAAWEGKLYDLSQQTGVSVELLSALSAVAEDTGGSIESVAQSLVVFQGHLDDAQDSASKTGQRFTELGISTDNTEQAFRDALKALAAMPEGFRQTNEAAELFGRRGGKQILAILKETGGDIDAVMEKLRGLDSLVTNEIAKTADELNDQLNATQRQFRGLQAQIVNESMPHIIKALEQFSRILRDNRETFVLLGQAIGLFLQGNFRILAPAMDIASRAVDGHKRALLPLIETYERLAAVMQIVTNSIPNVDPNAIPAVATSAPFNSGATLGAVSQILGAGVARPRGSGGGGGGGSAAAQISAGQRLLNELTREFARLQDEVNSRTRFQITLLDERYLKASEGERRAIEAKAREIRDLEETTELNKRKADALRSVAGFIAQQEQAIRDARLGEDQWDKELRQVIETLTKLGVKIDDVTFARIKNNYETLKALKLTREEIELEQTRIDRMQRDRLATPERKQEQLEKESGIFRSEGDETRDRRVDPPDVSIWDETLGAIEERMEDFHEASQNYVVGAFHGMADAATSAIEAWLLYGGSLKKALAQAVAAELASISARAMVQAALHAAYAIGSLAMGNFGAAATHGIAAAKFAAVAALTGVAARGLATVGGSFQQAAQNSGAVSRGGGSSFGNNPSPRQDPGVIDVNRRALPAVHVTVQLHGDIATDALKTKVVNAVVESLDLNDDRLTGKIQGAAQRGR